MNRREDRLLLGEWACLGILYPAPVHGFAVAARLKPEGDIGRVWSLSRALTYRSLDQLVVRGHIAATGEEPGIAGGNRTILAVTSSGKSEFRRWVRSPVEHQRDLRSELLLKLVLADNAGIDVSAMLVRQRDRISTIADAMSAQLDETQPLDVVALWRSESSQASLRFLDRVIGLP